MQCQTMCFGWGHSWTMVSLSTRGVLCTSTSALTVLPCLWKSMRVVLHGVREELEGDDNHLGFRHRQSSYASCSGEFRERPTTQPLEICGPLEPGEVLDLPVRDRKPQVPASPWPGKVPGVISQKTSQFPPYRCDAFVPIKHSMLQLFL